MITHRNTHVFKGHKTILGSKFVTYGEVELPLRYELFSKSSSGFDWGHNGPAAMQLSFSMLCQVSDEKVAKRHVLQFNKEIVKNLNSRDWVLPSSEVIEWLEANEESLDNGPALVESTKRMKKLKSKKDNIVKSICKELEITQKQLAEILEVPEGTVSSWAVKNEIPRLGKKAIEFYTLNAKNQQIVNSYKNFIDLLQEAS